MPDFSTTLLQWYFENKRDLPWRETTDPYKIWLSEVILQQTRVAQGLPYYQRFIKNFPSVYELANASEERVLKLWQGLGYYSRARNLHAAAQMVVADYNGVFPKNYADLKKLKGVGEYTASAVASIVGQEPVAVLDGNVYRVLARFLGIDTPINITAGKRLFKEKAERLLDKKKPGQYNQAVMEFGALQCKPQNPDCFSCPLQTTCVAHQQGKVTELPVKIKKLKVRKRYLNYIVFFSADKKTILCKRVGKGIWQNLYEFPLIETSKEITKSTLLHTTQFKGLTAESVSPYTKKSIKHLLSHQKLLIKFWLVTVKEIPQLSWIKNETVVKWSQVDENPVPIVIHKFIEAVSTPLEK